MTKKFKVVDYDIIYLSYDEPNAEKNYADLCQKIPWAKRVHGVKGSDAAHKACANISETDRFITVDGDNIVDQKFINQEIDFSEHTDLEQCVISWSALNQVNGLMYGNGGIKCWPQEYVLRMKTHEAADPTNKHAQVDFCWDTKYIQMDGCFSKIYNNATPHQAWRAGFREGVKMALDRGVKPTVEDFYKNHWKNMHRLYIWLTVGADSDNGLWAILGAREGLYKTMCTEWDFIQVRDFEYLNMIWERDYLPIQSEDLVEQCMVSGSKIKSHMKLPFPVEPLSAEQSEFFKVTYQNPARMSDKIIQIEGQ